MSPQDRTVERTPSSSIRVPCPGVAHARGEPCLVCDRDDNGTILVIITGIELDALAAGAQGRIVDGRLAPRLRKLGLLQDVLDFGGPLAGAGARRPPRSMRPTARGRALLAKSVWRSN